MAWRGMARQRGRSSRAIPTVASLRIVLLATTALIGVAMGTSSGEAATFTVINGNDSGAGSLRQAILDSNSSSGSNFIDFQSNSTITLSSTLPTLTQSVTLESTLGDNPTITGGGSPPFFTANSGVALGLAASGGQLTASTGVAANGVFDISATPFRGFVQTLSGSGTVALGGAGLVILAGSTEFSGVIGGGGGVEIVGGTQTLSGANTYANVTQIDSGAALALKGGGSIANSAYVAFFFGGTLDISQTTAGATVGGLFDPFGSGVVSLGSQALTITNGSFFKGVIKDGGIGGGSGGGLTIANGAVQSLYGTNTYTGLTTINSGGELDLVGSGGLNGSIATSSGVVANGVFDISGLTNRSAVIKSLSGSGQVNLGSAALTLTNASGTFSGLIADGGRNGGTGGTLTLNGGTEILTGANTYTGGTHVAAGTLGVGNSAALGTGQVILFDNTTLAFVAGGLNLTNRILLGTPDPTIDTGANTDTISGVISGAGSLTKAGTGTLILTNADTYSGGTTIAAGTLQLGNGGTTGSIIGNVVDNGTFAVNRSNAYTFGGVISGAGAFQQLGSGTTTLTAINTYTGATTVAAGGTLALSGGGSIATSSGVATNGTFDISGLSGSTSIASLSGTATGVVTLGTNTLTLTNAAGIFAGAIAGSGSLKLAGGTEVLTGAGSYSGGTTIAAGTLQLGNGGTSGSIVGNVVDNGTFAINRSDAYTFGGVIAGTGAVQQLGTGTTTLTGVNTYTGATTIAVGGTLALSGAGSIAASSSIAANGTFDISKLAGGTAITSLSGAASGAVVLGTNTLTVTNGSGVFAGTITGAGSLVLAGGTETLDGASGYSGGTLLQAGTLVIGNSAALGTGALRMDDGTVLAFGADNLTLSNSVVFTGANDPTIDTGTRTATIAGSLSGAGALTKAGSGTLILTGTNTYSGGTTIATGTLQIGNGGRTGSIVGDVANSGALVFDRADDVTFAGGISGSGRLSQIGTGTLTLTGTSSVAGATTIATGTLIVDGSLANSAVTIDSGGTLGGRGTVGGITADAGSTVAPGAKSPYGTLHVAGSVAFNTGSTYEVGIAAGGKTDNIAATGAAKLAGGTVDVLAASGGTYSTATRYTVLTASRGVSGQFADATSNLAFLSPVLTYGRNAVTLGFANNAASNNFPSVAATRNESATAAALQGLGSGSALYNAVLGQTAAGARQAFDAASGEIHASAATAAVEDSRFVREAIFDRLWDASSGGPDATQILGGFAPATSLPPAARGYAPVPAAATAALPAPYAIWGQGFGDFGRNGGDHNAATLDRSLGGFILGGDTRLYGALGDAWRVGVAGGYTNDSLDVAARGSAGTFESIFGAVYGAANYGAFDLRLGAAYGGNGTNINRTVSFPGFNETEHSSYSGETVQGFGELGYRIILPRGILEPVLDGAVIHVHQDAFHEAGGAAALLGLGQDTDVGTTTLGIRGEVAPFAAYPIVARGFLGWRHAFGDVVPTATQAFESGSPAFTVAGAPVARDAMAVEAGLDWRALSALTLGISYSGQVGGRANDEAVKGKMEYRF